MLSMTFSSVFQRQVTRPVAVVKHFLSGAFQCGRLLKPEITNAGMQLTGCCVITCMIDN